MKHGFPMGESDYELLAKVAKNDDTSAFEIIYRRHGHKLFRSAYFRIGNKERAEEITSDALFLLWKKRKTLSLDESASIYPWLFATTRNFCLASNRKNAKEKSASTEFSEQILQQLEFVNNELHQNLDDSQIIEALNLLNPADREVIILRIIDGYSHREIAQILDINQPAARTRLSRGLRHLEKQFKSIQLNSDNSLPIRGLNEFR